MTQHARSENYDETEHQERGHPVPSDLADPCYFVVRLIEIRHLALHAFGTIILEPPSRRNLKWMEAVPIL